MPENLLPTYAFEDGQVLAFFENQCIAIGPKFAEVEQTAVDYLDTLGRERKQRHTQETERKATHITTPNGLKGEILGRTAGLWADEITVRFENNQIRRFATHSEDGFKYSVEEESIGNPVVTLEQRLEEDYNHDRPSLVSRVNNLAEVRHTVAALIGSGVSYEDEAKLHKVALTAEAEQLEIKDAIDHLDSVDAEFAAPDAPQFKAIEQADLGKSSKDNWLDVVAREMIAESENQDLDALLEEGPTLFVADLDEGALADTGVTSSMARNFIISKTAGFEGAEVEDYRDRFAAGVEIARRQELALRKDNMSKEAAVREELQADVPDDALFI